LCSFKGEFTEEDRINADSNFKGYSKEQENAGKKCSVGNIRDAVRLGVADVKR
jgi:hypothetical protein